jgi:hypothetical protein
MPAINPPPPIGATRISSDGWGLQHLQRNGPLSRDDLLVIVGVNPCQSPLFRQGERMALGVIEQLPVQDDLRAVVARVLDLDPGGISRHHDHGRDAESLRVVGHTLGVIARGRGDHAGTTLPLVEAAQLVERTTLLERGGELEVLELQEDVRTRDTGQGA